MGNELIPRQKFAPGKKIQPSIYLVLYNYWQFELYLLEEGTLKRI